MLVVAFFVCGLLIGEDRFRGIDKLDTTLFNEMQSVLFVTSEGLVVWMLQVHECMKFYDLLLQFQLRVIADIVLSDCKVTRHVWMFSCLVRYPSHRLWLLC